VKLLLLIFIVYLAYRAGKSWLMRNLQAPAQNGSRHPNIDDVMVQDPVCGIYIPRREGLELQHKGQTHMFCSTACRDRFLEAQKDNGAGK
jgi:YHS domain-containing protein